VSAKKNNFVPLFGVAFIVAILSTGVFYGLFVGKLNSASRQQADKPKVLVAARSIDPGTVLKAADVVEVPWAGAHLPAGSVSKIADAEGTTVVERLAQDELITRSALASKEGGPAESGSMGIPDGMRAVSLQVQDSQGVVAMLKPGHRVDVQVVATLPGFLNEPQLRTILENIAVLAIPKEAGARGQSQIVTLLATPKEAAVLGLADSSAKVRLALRNPMDQKKENLNTVGLSAVLRQGTQPSSSQANKSASGPSALILDVRLVEAAAEAVKDLEGLMLAAPAPNAMLQVTRLHPVATVEKTLDRLHAAKIWEVLHSSRLSTAGRREVRFETLTLDKGNPQKIPGGLRVQFLPLSQSGDKVRIRVQPEISTPGDSETSRRRIETEVELADGQSFLLRGFGSTENERLLWESLFPGKLRSDREIVMLVTFKLVPHVAQKAHD
jgi:Flp pilus assembly protein CpaB